MSYSFQSSKAVRYDGVAWIQGFVLAIAFGGFANAQDTAPAAASTDKPVPTRVLWVDQNDPKAADTADGSETTPFKTISRAAEVVRPGDLVRIRTGTYRETVTIKASGEADKPIRFEAAQDAHVVVTGADEIKKDALVREPEADNVFSTAWPYKFLLYMNKDGSGSRPANDYHKMIGRCEQVIVDGYLLHQVLDRSQLNRGSFYVDLASQRLYIWDSSNGDLKAFAATTQASTRSLIWTMEGNYLQTTGLRFRYAANSAQSGAVQLLGHDDVIEDSTIERTNGVGITIEGKDDIVRRCLIQDNGELGFAAVHTTRFLMTECTVRNNNIKNFDRTWECGNCKIVLSSDAVVEKSTFSESRGVGMWFDIGNENATVRNCLIANNEESGIFYEISFGLHAHDNVIIGNGFDAGPAGWGGDGAISLSNSPGCVIERNLMVGNYNGFEFISRIRTTPRIGQPKGALEEAVWVHDEVIQNNVIADNLKWQISHWVDIKGDVREWPSAMQGQFAAKAAIGTVVPSMADNYVAKDDHGQPQGLSLEKLNLQFKDNIYSQNPGEGFCLWGVPWRDHKAYGSLQDMLADLKIDEGSIEAPVVFADPAELDFRVPAGSSAIRMNCYPQGEVPGVKLGKLP